MVSVASWRLKEEGDAAKEGDIVCADYYQILVIYRNDVFWPFCPTWYEILNHGWCNYTLNHIVLHVVSISRLSLNKEISMISYVYQVCKYKKLDKYCRCIW